MPVLNYHEDDNLISVVRGERSTRKETGTPLSVAVKVIRALKEALIPSDNLTVKEKYSVARSIVNPSQATGRRALKRHSAFIYYRHKHSS